MSDVNLLEEQPAIESAVNKGVDGKPEGVPEKFWDVATQTVRVDELLKSYLALEKKLGAGFSVPEDEEGRLNVLRALGLPETPDAYQITLKDDLLQVDADVNTRLHAKGFTSEQVQEVYDLASEKLVPMILDIAAEFQADREIERLVANFGGAEQWREVSRQLLAYGRKNLPADVLSGMSASYEGVMALYRMMKGDSPQALPKGEAVSDMDEAALQSLMRDPKYWRDKDPAVIAKVTQGFKKIYG